MCGSLIRIATTSLVVSMNSYNLKETFNNSETNYQKNVRALTLSTKDVPKIKLL